MLFALLVASCSAEPSDQDPDLGEADAGTAHAMPDATASDAPDTQASGWTPGSDPDKRLGDLTDADFELICADVERQVDLECGTDPETGEPIIYRETPGRRDCIAALEKMKEYESEVCLLADDVASCWAADFCDRRQTEVCDITCPEYEACWTYGVDDCEERGGDWCTVIGGQKYDPENDCFVQQDVYCSPSNFVCANAFTTALDPEGECWLFNSICPIPDGWEHEDGERTCPYLGDAETCP